MTLLDVIRLMKYYGVPLIWDMAEHRFMGEYKPANLKFNIYPGTDMYVTNEMDNSIEVIAGNRSLLMDMDNDSFEFWTKLQTLMLDSYNDFRRELTNSPLGEEYLCVIDGLWGPVYDKCEGS